MRTQSQGLIDAIVWGSAVFASIASGQLFGFGGYTLVAGVSGVLAVVPLVLVCVVRHSQSSGQASRIDLPDRNGSGQG